MGTLRIEESALLPDFVWFKSEQYSNGWIVFQQLDGNKVNRKIREEGWAFCSIAGRAKASAFGFDAEKRDCVREKWGQSQVWSRTAAQNSPAAAYSGIAKGAECKTTKRDKCRVGR